MLIGGVSSISWWVEGDVLIGNIELCSCIQKHTPAHAVGLMLIKEWHRTRVPPPTARNRARIHKTDRIQSGGPEGIPSEMTGNVWDAPCPGQLDRIKEKLLSLSSPPEAPSPAPLRVRLAWGGRVSLSLEAQGRLLWLGRFLGPQPQYQPQRGWAPFRKSSPPPTE